MHPKADDKLCRFKNRCPSAVPKQIPWEMVPLVKNQWSVCDNGGEGEGVIGQAPTSQDGTQQLVSSQLMSSNITGHIYYCFVGRLSELALNPASTVVQHLLFYRGTVNQVELTWFCWANLSKTYVAKTPKIWGRPDFSCEPHSQYTILYFQKQICLQTNSY